MLLINLLALLFLFFIITVIILYFLFMVNLLVMGGHDPPTSHKAIKKILEIISERKKGEGNFYDLGSGRGEVVFAVKKEFPQISVFGIENKILQLFFARVKNLFFRQEINFIKEDLFRVNLKNADIVYTYLWYDLMPEVEKKIERELKKGTIIITNTSSLPNWKPEKTYITYPKKPDFEKLFLYVRN